jgi:predicted protein tyrosine phosphatase
MRALADTTRITVCGLADLDDAAVDATHVLSLLDPGHPAPARFAGLPQKARRTLWFHDIIADYPGYVAPRREHVEAVLEFGQGLADAPVGHLVVHCHAGVSRSTAALAILLAQAAPEDEHRAFARLVALRPQAWPNSRMIALADDLLARRGRLVAALEAYYRRQLASRPRLVDLLRGLGRDDEIPP